MNDIIVRKVKKEDIGEISAAFKKAYLPLFKYQNLSQATIDDQFLMNDSNHLLLRFKGNYFFIAQDIKNGKIVGLIGLRKDDNSIIHNRISTFFVLEDYRGKGVGSMLYQTILSLAKQLNVKKIVVNSSLYAEEAYQHWGFKKIKFITKKYPNGDVYKNVWMEKEIAS